MPNPVPEVRQGETIVLTASFKDKDGALVDPDVSQLIRIADPTNTLVVTDAAMETDGATGKWIYVYAVAADATLGEWAFECIGKDGATPDVSIGSTVFIVKLRIGG